jgi:orotate phosphoribosyltransferase
LAAVRAMFSASGVSSYGPTAFVGCILAGTLPMSVGRVSERYVQARLLAGGHWVGKAGCDGHLGNDTKKALRAAGIELVPGAVPTSGLIAALDAAEVGFDLLRAA